MPLAIRLPGTDTYYEFMFHDDTGANFMNVFNEDVEQLLDIHEGKDLPRPQFPPVLGVAIVRLANGTREANIFRGLEVNIFEARHSNDDMMMMVRDTR